MAEDSKQPKKTNKQPDRESRDSGIVSPERNKLVEEHFREHPEGDPAVRRVKPDRGSIPVEKTHDDGFMTVEEKDRGQKKQAS